MAKKKKNKKTDKIKTVAKVGAVLGAGYLLWNKVIAPKVLGGM